MKRKLISGLLTVAIVTTSVLPAFAADEQTSDIPVVGKIGIWNGSPTDPTDPNSGGGGGLPDPTDPTNPPINPPEGVTDINVTIPTAMTFNIVTNTKDKNPALASATYQIKNNASSDLKLDISSSVGDSVVEFKDSVDGITKKRDGKIQLALGMSINDGTNGTDMVVKNGDILSQYSIAGSKTYSVTFTKPGAGAFDDVKLEQLADTKTTNGTFTLKFTK